MAHGRILGRSRPYDDENLRPDQVLCRRCGRVRTIKQGRPHGPLCQDCKHTMTKEEIELWQTPAAA